MNQPRPATRSRRLARWVDDRLGTAYLATKALRKVFPDHWSFMLGELSLYSFVILVVTGVYLTFFFDPSQAESTYRGSYEAMRGVEMTAAYRSALELSFDVRAGLVMRQIHHWAALLFVATMAVHMARVFFTGAFRRPREINWMVGVTLLILAVFNGFAGYSLLDDQLSGTGLRIGYSIALSVPLVGTWLVSLLFGGEFPGPDIIERLYVIHILLVPAVIAALIGVHMAILLRQKHTQFAGPGRAEGNVVGERVWPTYAAKGLGLFFLTTAVLAALGGLAQINPIWIYGPFDPAEVSAASQPDWYMGWLDGAMRLIPPWEVRAFGYEVPNPFFPGAVLPGVTFALLYLWPFLEARFTGDRSEHHLLDRPRDRPVRTAMGVATIAFYGVLFLAGGGDVLSTTFGVSVNAVFQAFRVLLFVLPAASAWVAYRLCRDLAQRDPAPADDGSVAMTALAGVAEDGRDQDDRAGHDGPEAQGQAVGKHH
ncbi:MAG: ubiquinol-cytochrome c reductase cytochrome b subunit [Actinobacteria bacterium]|nr:ubiquinol-cytochrome c reductase cytochrome b subunit [Actinomycetota bacterium]MBW3649324.1 ubiquinol-cytochrome c reductase cytochrome b subunit [Actinomycetota bacterium]